MDKLQHTFLRYAQITLGCALYALGFCWFYAPNQLCMGGFTGLAQVISLFLSSLFIDLLDKTVTFQAIEPVLACVYGAVLVGAGCGLMLRQNATVGGTNLAARLLRLRLERVSIGTLCSLLDGLIVVMHVIAFRNLSHCLYAVASLYLISLIMDRVVYGGKQSKVACIISDRHEELTAALLVILCAFAKNQIIDLKKRVQQVDPDAFIIVYDANEVLGKGFGAYQPGSV